MPGFDGPFVVGKNSYGKRLYYVRSEGTVTIVSVKRDDAKVYVNSRAAKDAACKLNNRKHSVNDETWEIIKID